MAAWIVVGLFLAALLVSILWGMPLLYALIFGLVVFCAYARYQRFSAARIGQMLWEGVRNARVILTIMVLVGFLTASWRAGGTIPYVVDLGLSLLRPELFYLSVFLLCGTVSFITGTSFGTVSTIGVISMILARAGEYDLLIAGGAAMSGAYFGDRCSPMSSCAALVASLTKTNIYTNIKNMMKSCLIPLGLTCLLYLALSLREGGRALGQAVDFGAYFELSWPAAVPAVLVILLSVCKVDVRITMSLSILTASGLAVWLQKVPVNDLFRYLLEGYELADGGRVGEMLQGGGLQSMVDTVLVVLVSSAFFGLMKETGILGRFREVLLRLSRKLGRFGVMILTSFVAGGFACNQTLAAMLTCGLCEEFYDDPDQLANDMADSVVVIAGLIPWSIACAVPLAILEVGYGAMTYGCYLWLLPLVGLLTRRKRMKINK